jgi:hypothetical protein
LIGGEPESGRKEVEVKLMRGIAYERIKRGVLLASVGATFLAPAAAAQACPPPWAPAWGYWQHGPGTVQHGNGHSAGTITGHRIG